MSRAGAENETKDWWKMAGLKETAQLPGSKLECPICLDDLLSPIFQCFNGHLLCGTCIEAVAVCPICRDELPEKKIKALAVENLIREFQRPCPFRKNGCEKILTYSDGDHPFQCLYATGPSFSFPGAMICGPGQSGDDPGRPVASFSFTVTSISERIHGNKGVTSPVTYVRNLPWRIVLNASYRDNKKFLNIYLNCVEDRSGEWSCNAMVTFRILSHLAGPNGNGADNNYAKKTEELTFCPASSGWGVHEFMYWASLKDPAKGYVKNGSITLDVHIDTDIPGRSGSGVKCD